MQCKACECAKQYGCSGTPGLVVELARNARLLTETGVANTSLQGLPMQCMHDLEHYVLPMQQTLLTSSQSHGCSSLQQQRHRK